MILIHIRYSRDSTANAPISIIFSPPVYSSPQFSHSPKRQRQRTKGKNTERAGEGARIVPFSKQMSLKSKRMRDSKNR